MTLVCSLTSIRAFAQEPPPAAQPPSALAKLDLQALMNLEITSVSRRPERLSDAAASVYVITGDEIRRSGATNLPEALRLAPTLDVVQVNATGYTVNARGFVSAANKLLVLIDGRSVYSPLFSGVFWDVQDVLLEDIERIEVISGPGGTLWGVNAVNGVINIITYEARQTQGGLLTAGGGNQKTIGAIRYGGEAGANGHYRVSGKYSGVHRTETANGTSKDDSGHKAMVSLRGDWTRGADRLTLLGNAYDGSEGQPLPGTISISGIKLALGVIELSGQNLSATWSRQFNPASAITLQGYVDRTVRVVPPTFSDRQNTADLSFLHSLHLRGKRSVAWGGEYRRGRDRVTNLGPYFAFLPPHVSQSWIALFGQAEIPLREDLRLSVGARGERNDYTGNEFLPSLRLAWNAAPDHLLWAAASRTVRAPSRLDVDAFVPAKPPFLLTGGPGVVSEVANVYEVGYRGQPSPALTLSATLFHSVYDHLRTQEIAPSQTSIFFANGMKGTTSGLETWASVQATQRWRLSAGFNGLHMDLRLRPGSNDVAGRAATLGRDPRRSWRLRSSLDLPRQGELDVVARRVSARSDPAVPAYTAVDVRYGWQVRRGLELSVTGQNLLGDGHGEATDIATRSEIGRGVFVNLVGRFGRGS